MEMNVVFGDDLPFSAEEVAAVLLDELSGMDLTYEERDIIERVEKALEGLEPLYNEDVTNLVLIAQKYGVDTDWIPEEFLRKGAVEDDSVFDEFEVSEEI